MYCTSKCCENPPYGRVPIRRPGLDEEEKVEEEQRSAEEGDKWVMREPPQPLRCSVPWMPSSKVGLGVVAEYTTDELAEGSDDERGWRSQNGRWS